MIGRQRHMAGEIKRLRHQIVRDPESLKGDEKKKIWLMEQGRREALEIERKITSSEWLKGSRANLPLFNTPTLFLPTHLPLPLPLSLTHTHKWCTIHANI